jgi:phosphoglycolate phosphatase
MKHIETLVLDFNGTILDDVALCAEIVSITLVKYGLPPLSVEKYKEIFTFPVKDYYARAGFDFTKYDFAVVGKEFNEIYDTRWGDASIYPDALDLFAYFKDKRIVCLSATKEDMLIKQLSFYGIKDKYNDIVGINDTFAASKMGVAMKFFKDNHINPKTTLLVGDSKHDLEIADAFGCDHLIISTGHQSIKTIPTKKIINSLSEIKKFYV